MTHQVGPGGLYPGLGDLVDAQVLAPGDLVELYPKPPGEFYTATLKWTYPVPGVVDPITFRGINDANGKRPVFDGRGKIMEAPRAFFEFYASNGTGGVRIDDGAWIVENLEFAYAINATNEMNAAGVRNANAASVIVRGCKIWNCASGVMSSESSGETIIEDCDIGFCGYGDGHSHCIYTSGMTFRLRHSRIHDSIWGQNVKSRNRFVEIAHNQIFYSRDGEIGVIQAGDGTPEDSQLTSQPGSNALILDNEITTRPDRSGGNKNAVVVFGKDMGTVGRNGTLYFHGNKIHAQHAENVPIKLSGSTTSLDARHNKFMGTLNILDERDPAVEVYGEANWHDIAADEPEAFVNPAAYTYEMGDGSFDAAPANRRLHSAIATPENIRDWNDQGGLGIEWDAVPGALFYRIWRAQLVNGQGVDASTIWGGATDTQYVDTFQHGPSSDSKRNQYVYRVQAVNMDGGQSELSAGWIKEHGEPGYAE